MPAAESVRPIRIQRRRTRGFDMQACSSDGRPVVYVGRPSKWGAARADDPKFILRANARRIFLEIYRSELLKAIAEDPTCLEPLRDKHLACWCPLDQSCHADILLDLANA